MRIHVNENTHADVHNFMVLCLMCNINFCICPFYKIYPYQKLYYGVCFYKKSTLTADQSRVNY